MRKFLKRVGIGCGGLLALIGVALAVAYLVADVRLKKVYEIPPAALSVPSGAAAVERGQRLVELARCADCHGFNLDGQVMDDSPVVGRFVATNLTSGKGGIGGQFSDADWERALRHGVRPDGRSLLITPAQYYYYLSDDDAGDMIAYLKSLRPQDRELPTSTLGPLGRLILFLRVTDWLPAEKIDHVAPRPPAPAPGVTAEYGEYIARIGNCQVCHGLERSDNLAGWTEAEFVHAMNTGLGPTGLLDRGSMPIGILTEDEIRALWLYLQTLPAAAF